MNWYTKSKADDLQGLVIEEETGRNVAVTYDPKDAALVAAAPELLSALKALLPLWDREDVADTFEGEFHVAYDAIRKAEGE